MRGWQEGQPSAGTVAVAARDRPGDLPDLDRGPRKIARSADDVTVTGPAPVITAGPQLRAPGVLAPRMGLASSPEQRLWEPEQPYAVQTSGRARGW